MSITANHILRKSSSSLQLVAMQGLAAFRGFHAEVCPPEVCPGDVPGRSKCCRLKRSPPRPCLMPLPSCCSVPLSLCPRPQRPPQPDCCPIIIPTASCGYCPGPCPRCRDIPC
ncbi:unnamed protein product [Nezara viridula]|uniref:Uncharacterized protein n=1 Tax=Nezara viridula TaxID=85310 RepID=A0A9P0E624_NEZVI|nr:unnamed protein product [Nezara viridula]